MKKDVIISIRGLQEQDGEAGDPITYKTSNGIVVTHRIVEVLPDEADGASVFFRTQGIANNAPDANPVHSKNVLGTPVCCIPCSRCIRRDACKMVWLSENLRSIPPVVWLPVSCTKHLPLCQRPDEYHSISAVLQYHGLFFRKNNICISQ